MPLIPSSRFAGARHPFSFAKRSGALLLLVIAAQIGGSCKPRPQSRLADASDGVVDVKTLNAQLIEISGLLEKHTSFGIPLEIPGVDQDGKATGEGAKNTLPLPNGCQADLWATDLRWGSDSIATLQAFARGMHDVRVRAAAIDAVATIGNAQGLACTAEQISDLLATLAPAGTAVCTTYARCAIVAGLVGSLIDSTPQSAGLASVLDAVEQTIKTLDTSSANTRNLLLYKIAAYRLQLDYFRTINMGEALTTGHPIVLSKDEYQRLDGAFMDLFKLGYEKLFVISQMRDRINISPSLIQEMLTRDMLAGVDFKSLDQDVQEFLLQEVMGFFESSWQMQLYTQALHMYLARLGQADPRPWLADVKKAAARWSAANDSFGDDAFSLTGDDAGASFRWQEGVHPRVAMNALVQFVDLEARLPWRRAFAQTTTLVYELVPPEDRDANLAMNYLKALQAGTNYRESLLSGLEARGITSVPDDEDITAEAKQKAIASSEKIKQVVASLLTNEEAMADYFSRFSSVYHEFIEFYGRLGDRMVTIEQVLEQLKSGHPNEQERDELLGELDRATERALDQWVKIRCLDLLFKASRQGGGSTMLSEPFVLDEAVKIEFQCRPESTGEDPRDISRLVTRIGNYTGALTYARAVDRGLAHVKEAAAIGALLVIGLPAGVVGNLAAAGARYLLVNAAKVGLLRVLQRQLVQRMIIGGITLYANVWTFTKLMKLNDKLWTRMLGMSPPAHMEETWGQYIFHTAQGMAVFASLHHVSRLSRVIAQRMGARSGSYQAALKPTWKAQVAEFSIGGVADTTLFFGSSFASEALGKELGVYERLTEDQEIFRRLYMPTWSENLKHAFATAVVFRSFGLLQGRAHLSQSREVRAFSAGAQGDLNKQILNKQALEVLGVPDNASAATIKAAYMGLVKKYHPDRVQGALNRAMDAAGLSGDGVSRVITKAASTGTSFDQLRATLKLTPEQASVLESSYRQYLDHYIMTTRANTARDLLIGNL